MLYVRALTSTARRALRQLRRYGTPRLVHRAQIVLLSADGWSVPAIARALRCCRRTVRCWIHAFAQGGLAQLAGKTLGRPPRVQPHFSAMTFQDDICQPSTYRLVPAIELTLPETTRL